MKLFYEYSINGIYGNAKFVSDKLLRISDDCEFANTLVESFEGDYCEEKDAIVYDEKYGSKYNIKTVCNQRGLPDGIDMDIYFNMVMSHKDFNYGEIHNLKRQISDFETKQKRMKDEFASQLYYVKNRRK